MKKIISLYTIIFAAVAFAFVACDEDPTDDLEDIIKDDLGYVAKIGRFSLIDPVVAGSAPFAVPAGGNLTMDLRYWSEGTISGVEFYYWEKGKEATRIATQAYAPAFSKITKTDSLIFTYPTPALAAGTEFSIEARVITEGLEEYPTKSELKMKMK